VYCRVGSRREDLHNSSQPSSAHLTLKLNKAMTRRNNLQATGGCGNHPLYIA
jgi:hypothetical protein